MPKSRKSEPETATSIEEVVPELESEHTEKADGDNSPKLPTALIYDDAFLNHYVPQDFPETPDRVRAAISMIEALLEEGSLPATQVLRLTPRAATDDELARVHDPLHIQRLRHAAQALASLGEEQGHAEETRKFASEVYISSGSYTAATLAAGAGLTALDAIGEGRARNAYALVRPPGHHATKDTAMGFCLLNNAAVAARYAQERWGWNKVLIVDYDVHHGNGTQDIFYEDGSVVYFSTHQSPLYPGTGSSAETGAGAGLGATINVPLPEGSGWSVFDPIFRQVLWPVADRFRPDIILLSAGFDAHWRDPLGGLMLCNADYSDLTLEVAEIAEQYCHGRLVTIQEGGYHLDAVAQCAATVLFALTGSDKVVDNLGNPPPMSYRWNDEAIVRALYDLHDLTGYRRKPRRVQVRPGYVVP